MTRPKNLRAEMPATAAFLDDLRAAFGAEGINAQIKRGMDGLPGFYAVENGHEVGTPEPPPRIAITPSFWPEQHQRDQDAQKHADRNPRHR